MQVLKTGYGQIDKITLLVVCAVMLFASSTAVAAVQDSTSDESAGAPPAEQEQAGELGFEPPPGTVPDNPQALEQAELLKQRQQAIDQLVVEMKALVPMTVVEGSAQETALKDAAMKFANRDYVGMKESLDNARAEDPTFPPSELLWAAMLFAANDAENGRLMLEEAALQNPASPGVLLAFTRLAVNQRRFTDAGALLEKSAKLIQGAELNEAEDAHYKTLYYDMAAELAVKLGRFEDAQRSIQRLREVSPGDNKGDALLAEIEFENSNFDRAIQLLQTYREQKPEARVPELVLAAWLGERGRTEEIGAWIEKAGANYPDDAIVQLEFANYAVAQERFPEANKAIGAVENAVGETDVTKLLKGQIAFAGEAYALAESYYEQLATSDQNRGLDAANMYALCLIESEQAEKHQRARQIVENNFRAMPDSPIAQAAFAWVLYNQGDTQNALGLLSRATSVQPLAPEIAFYAAIVMRDQGRIEEAKEILRAAIEAEGLYLYRSRAKRLLSELDTQPSGELPAPEGDG